MTEQEFIESIDFSFPYNDKEKAIELIVQGRTISANATFMVLHEIVRSSSEVNKVTKESLFNHWSKGFSHELLPQVKEAASALLANEELPVERAIELMEKIKNHAGEYCALSIVYFSCDDTEGKADEKYNQIVEQWQSA
jgi:hypothetical protein